MSIFFWNIVMYKLRQINTMTIFIFISLFLILNDNAQGFFMFNESILSLPSQIKRDSDLQRNPYQSAFCGCDKNTTTKSNLKNKESISAYSSRGGVHNGEEDLAARSQSRRLTDHVSAAPGMRKSRNCNWATVLPSSPPNDLLPPGSLYLLKVLLPKQHHQLETNCSST